MATESIFHNVILDSDEKVSKFIEAAEKSLASIGIEKVAKKRKVGHLLSNSNSKKIKWLISENVARVHKINNNDKKKHS